MSHFIVVVIGDDIEAQLAPFQENNMGDCPKEYLAFNEIDLEKNGYYSREAALKDGYEEHEGKVGYWENPNAKWDWYVLGGRWSGMFPIKPSARPHEYGSKEVRSHSLGPNSLGIHAIMRREDQEKFDRNKLERRADWALKSAIDIDRMMDEHEARARDAWSYWAPALEGRPTPESWTTIRERHGVTAGSEVYRTQPAIVAWNAEYVKRGERSPYMCTPVEDYGFDLARYVARQRREALVPFAFLHDGKWAERGNMGWFGRVSDEKDRNEWVEQWEALWASLPDDARLSAVDCHI